MWNLGKRKCFLLALRRRAARVRRGHPAVCSSGTSNRRFICLLILLSWDRCPFAAADLHARAWLTFQSHRGLAHNTLDAYSRAVERYFRFLAQLHFSCISITRAEIGLYLASLQAAGAPGSRTLPCSSF